MTDDIETSKPAREVIVDALQSVMQCVRLIEAARVRCDQRVSAYLLEGAAGELAALTWRKGRTLAAASGRMVFSSAQTMAYLAAERILVDVPLPAADAMACTTSAAETLARARLDWVAASGTDSGMGPAADEIYEVIDAALATVAVEEGRATRVSFGCAMGLVVRSSEVTAAMQRSYDELVQLAGYVNHGYEHSFECINRRWNSTTLRWELDPGPLPLRARPLSFIRQERKDLATLVAWGYDADPIRPPDVFPIGHAFLLRGPENRRDLEERTRVVVEAREFGYGDRPYFRVRLSEGAVHGFVDARAVRDADHDPDCSTCRNHRLERGR